MFGPFERAVAGRYLRARRGERFVSVIAGFSLVGIALGVATLIIVMSVMGGFQTDLLNRILGFNGHLGVYGAAGRMENYDPAAAKIRAVPGVVSAAPVIDGQVLLSGPRGMSSGGLVRGIEPKDLAEMNAIKFPAGNLSDFQGEDAIGDRDRAGREVRLRGGRRADAGFAAGRGDGVRHHPAGSSLQDRGDLLGWHERIRYGLCVPAVDGGADLLPGAGGGVADRGAGG